MKKVFVILCLLIFSVSTVQADAPRMGIKAGVNFANIDATIPNQAISARAKIKSGLVAGVWGEVPLLLRGSFTARGDVLYTQKGAKYDQEGNLSTIIADELTFSPFFVYYFPVNVTRPFLEAGPELGLTVADGYKENGNTHDSNGNWKASNISVNLGGGLEFQLARRAVFVEVRYNLGLTDMGSWYSVSDNSQTTKTHGIQLLASVQMF